MAVWSAAASSSIPVNRRRLGPNGPPWEHLRLEADTQRWRGMAVRAQVSMAAYELAQGSNNGGRGGAAESLDLPTVEGRCSKVGDAARAMVVLLVGGERWRRCCGDGFMAAALLCSGAVLGGERRTGKEEQASEWRGRQQATLGLSLQPATTCRGSAGALLPRGARKLSRSATQSDSKPEWSCKYHLKNAPETQTSSLRNS